VAQIRRLAEEATREFSKELNLQDNEPPPYQYQAPLPPPPTYVPPVEASPPAGVSEAVAAEPAVLSEPTVSSYSLLKSDDSVAENSIGDSLATGSVAAEEPATTYDDLGIHSDFRVPEETEDTPVEFKPSIQAVPITAPAPSDAPAIQNGHATEVNGEDAPKPPRRRRTRKKPVEPVEAEEVQAVGAEEVEIV
jgi:hypothetical protein